MTTYKPGNRFLPRLTLADAAVQWQGIEPTRFNNISINDNGLPQLAGCPELLERAEALLVAAESGLISGLTTNEDGYPLAASLMRLDRGSVLTFTRKADELANAPVRVRKSLVEDDKDKLLKEDAVLEEMQFSQSTLKRLRNRAENPFPPPSLTNPNRWSQSQIAEWRAKEEIAKQRRASAKPGSVEDDI